MLIKCTDPIWLSYSEDGEWEGEGDHIVIVTANFLAFNLAVMTIQILPSRGSIHSDSVATVQFLQEALLA